MKMAAPNYGWTNITLRCSMKVDMLGTFAVVILLIKRLCFTDYIQLSQFCQMNVGCICAA